MSRRDTPKSVAIMGTAAALGLGVASWSIKNALAPPPVAATPPAPIASTPPEPPPATPGEAKSEAAPQLAANKPGAGPTEKEKESELAAGVDPFVSATGTAPPVFQSSAPPQTVPAPQKPLAQAPLIAVPLPGGNPPAGVVSSAVAPAVVVVEPQLVGTLLGERPSAVFRGDNQLAVVPVGGAFGPWKVIKVSHGDVVVKSSTRTLHLGVGNSPTPATSTGSAGHATTNALPIREYIPGTVGGANASNAPIKNSFGGTPEAPASQPKAGSASQSPQPSIVGKPGS